MTTILPVKLDGPHITFTAALENGDVYAETWTITDDDGLPRDAESSDATRLLPEFEALVAAREIPAETDPMYLDPGSGKKLTLKQAERAFEDALPKPPEPTPAPDENEPGE